MITNEQFAAMSPAEKRVALAEDVLKWIAMGTLIPTGGTYLETDLRVRLTKDDAEKEVAEFLPQATECRVCAVGSFFYCAILRADNLKIGNMKYFEQFGTRDFDDLSFDYHEYLAEYFSEDQITMIESMFETGRCYVGPQSTLVFMPDEPRKVAESRMTWIMKNVIANGGEMVPTWVEPTEETASPA